MSQSQKIREDNHIEGRYQDFMTLYNMQIIGLHSIHGDDQ